MYRRYSLSMLVNQAFMAVWTRFVREHRGPALTLWDVIEMMTSKTDVIVRLSEQFGNKMWVIRFSITLITVT